MTEEKLQLLEFLLASEDAVECAQHAVEWVGAHTRAKHVLCAAVDPGGSRLVGTAAYGLEGFEPQRFTLDLEDRTHPILSTLNRLHPTLFRVTPRQHPGGVFLPDGTFLVLPLHGLFLEEDLRAGVLLVSPVLPAIVREARWVVNALGPRLTRLRSYRSLADAQRRLDRDRTLLQTVLDAASDPILLTDTEGRMLVANASAEKLFASREDESEGRRRAVALNNMLFSAGLQWTAVSGGEPVRRELLLADPQEGSDLLFERLSATVNDPQHGTGIVSILKNVTDLRRATEEIEENYRKLRLAENEVRADRDRLNLVIDSVADPILVTDPSGQIILTNTPAERLFTIPPDAPDDAARRVRSNDAHFSSFVSNLLFVGESQRYSGYIGLVDPRSGVPAPFDATAAKVLSEHGELIGVVTILHDRTEAIEKERLYEQVKRASDELEEKVRQATTELVRQNELLRRQHIQLEQASALKSQFLANMSHEFRTPLNAILGYTSMLLQGVSGRMTPPQKRDLSRVDSNARHLLMIINDILDISRIEAGKMPLTVTEFPIPELVSEVMAELEPIVLRTRLKVTTELDASATLLRSDRQKVKQIVLNLLSNALKFTTEGSITLTTRYKRSLDETWIAVKDTGIGIAPEDQSRIFEDFSQADSSPARPYGGAGLGLSICRRLATMLGGKITLSSMPGAGSTFTLMLPRGAKRRR